MAYNLMKMAYSRCDLLSKYCYQMYCSVLKTSTFLLVLSDAFVGFDPQSIRLSVQIGFNCINFSYAFYTFFKYSYKELFVTLHI